MHHDVGYHYLHPHTLILLWVSQLSGYAQSQIATRAEFSALCKEFNKFWAIYRMFYNCMGHRFNGRWWTVLPTHRKVCVSLSTVFSHLTFISALWDEECLPSLEIRKARHLTSSKIKHLVIVELGVVWRPKRRSPATWSHYYQNC